MALSHELVEATIKARDQRNRERAEAERKTHEIVSRRLRRELEIDAAIGLVKAKHAAEDGEDKIQVHFIPDTCDAGKAIAGNTHPSTLASLASPYQDFINRFKKEGLEITIERALKSIPEAPGRPGGSENGYWLVASWPLAK